MVALQLVPLKSSWVFQDNNRAVVLLGMKTFGKGLVQSELQAVKMGLG